MAKEGSELLLDIHGGVCAHHAGPCTLMEKAFRHSFYWPTALVDARDLIRTCKGSQYYAKQSHLLT
jgi:hypothetical protein